MKLEIKKPCTENWNKMTPVDQGRHCQSCQKDVVDFTTKSIAEISAFFQQQTGKVCGHFEPYQLQNFNAVYQEMPTASNIRKWSLAAVMAGVFAYPILANQQTHTTPVQEGLITEMLSSYISETVDNLFVPVGDSITLKGRVTGIKSNSLIRVSVKINSINLEATLDKKGNFNLVIPKSDQELTITASYGMQYTEFETQKLQFIANQNQQDILFHFRNEPRPAIHMKGDVSFDH